MYRPKLIMYFWYELIVYDLSSCFQVWIDFVEFELILKTKQLKIILYILPIIQVKVDDVDIKELNLSWLRSQIGVVSQDPILVRSNDRREHPIWKARRHLRGDHCSGERSGCSPVHHEVARGWNLEDDDSLIELHVWVEWVGILLELIVFERPVWTSEFYLIKSLTRLNCLVSVECIWMHCVAVMTQSHTGEF